MLKLAALIALINLCSCAPRVSQYEEPAEDEFAVTEGEAVELIEELETGEVVTSSIDDAQTKVLIGKANLQLEDYEKAIEYFLDAISLQPGLREQIYPYLADAYRFSAESKIISEEYEKAVYHFQRMMEIDFAKLDETMPSVIEAYKGYAREMNKEGGVDEVFASYSVLLEYSPNNSDMIIGAGEIAFSVGRYTKALEYFEKAKEVDEDVAQEADYYISQIYFARGKNHQENGAYDKAITNFNDAKKFNPKIKEDVDAFLVQVHLKFGEVFKKEGDFKEAEKQWQICLELSPGNMIAYSNLGLLYIDRGEDRDALDMYNLMLDLEPENLEVLEKLADLTLKLQQFKKAHDILVKVIGLDSEHLYTRFNKNLADIFFLEEKYQSAIKYYIDYLNFYPGDAEASFQIARAYSFVAEYSLAGEYLRQAIAIDKSWEDQGGFYWKFRIYQLRVLIVAVIVLLLLGIAGFIFYIFSKKKIHIPASPHKPVHSH